MGETIEVLTLAGAAAVLGVDRRAAESALRRAGIRSGYPRTAVEWLRDNRPGQGARTDLATNSQENNMDRVISLNPWQDGRGWVWEIENSEGAVRRSRTDTNYQGLYGQTRPGEEWGQSLGHMQITWPEDREAMIRRLAQPRNGNPGLDISALRPPTQGEAT